MEEAYQAAGHTTCVLGHKNWLRRAHPVRFAKDVVMEWRKAGHFEELIGQIKPEIVYINTAVSLAAALAARRCQIPVVWHIRELFADVGGEMRAPAFARPFVRSIFTKFSIALVVNSRAVALNILGERHASKAVVIPNAVGPKCFDSETTSLQARRDLGLPLGGRIVCVPGTLRPMKGHVFFLRAMADLMQRVPDLWLALTGDGETVYVDELVREADRIGISQRLIMTGALDGLTKFYRACDVICVPSRAEPFGRVVIEALAAGRAVVATAVGGNRTRAP
jgi:glycosyltransferase involved in cell wall biosynthesis